MNFLKSLFRCFGPGSAYIVPAIEGPDDFKSNVKVGRGVRQKSQLDTGTGNDIENDCLLLIGMIRVDENEIVNSSFGDPTKALKFSFVDLTLSTAFRAPVGKVLNGISPLRMVLGKAILRDVSDFHTDCDTKAMVTAVHSFLDNMGRGRSFRESKSKSFSNPGSLTFEGLIIITVSTRRNYVMLSVSCHFEDQFDTLKASSSCQLMPSCLLLRIYSSWRYMTTCRMLKVNRQHSCTAMYSCASRGCAHISSQYAP